MKIHHLNCATMRPPLAKWAVNDQGKMVCHVLLLETSGGLCLVDTGIGRADCADPAGRLGKGFKAFAGPVCDENETALRQIERLGYDRKDVRHIVLTHMDLDHAGGLGDFPDATVHIHAPEHAAAMSPRTVFERERYKPAQWAHGPKWKLYSPDGERWNGLLCVRPLEGLPPEIALVPLIGHTRGHAGVAVQDGDRMLLHAGDAYFHHHTLLNKRRPWGLVLFQRFTDTIHAERVANQERLRELASKVEIFSAHDPTEYDRLRR